MVSPGIQLPAYSPGATAEGAGKHARKDAEHDPHGEDRDDAEQNQQCGLDHETLPFSWPRRLRRAHMENTSERGADSIVKY
jgi:hypothetical protein